MLNVDGLLLLAAWCCSTHAVLTAERLTGAISMDDGTQRPHVACGFALLQVERKQVAVDRLQLSRKPAWAVQAYHSLRLMPGLVGDAVTVDSDQYVTFNYWQAAEVSIVRACCVTARRGFRF